MISLFLGVPGSGKSLHAVKLIVRALKRGKTVITNVRLNEEAIKGFKGKYIYRGYDKLNPVEFMGYALLYEPDAEEHDILIVIDECQVLINSREFQNADRKSWVNFATNHRHMGFDVILITQYDKAIDKQIRNVVERYVLHRVVNHYSFGRLVPIKLFLALNFVVISAKKQSDGHEFFVVGSTKRYYDTHQTRQDIFLVFPEVKKFVEKERQKMIKLESINEREDCIAEVGGVAADGD